MKNKKLLTIYPILVLLILLNTITFPFINGSALKGELTVVTGILGLILVVLVVYNLLRKNDDFENSKTTKIQKMGVTMITLLFLSQITYAFIEDHTLIVKITFTIVEGLIILILVVSLYYYWLQRRKKE